MQNNRHDKLLKILFPNRRGLNQKKWSKINNYPNIVEYLNCRYSDSFNILESIKRIKLNIEEKPKCTYCGSPTIFIGKQTKMFTKYCSNSCRAKDVSCHIWQQAQRKYNKEHYGVEYNFQIQKCKDKREATLIRKYENSNSNKIPYTHIIFEIANKKLLEKYGCTFGEMMKQPIFKQKRIDTLRKNGTFNTSKPEDKSYELLKELYPDVIRQYKDNIRYPFACDFYIPSQDLFIECQYCWTHGKHPYDENNSEDVDKLNKWKERYGNHWWHTWAEYDLKKRNIAKSNNLNYIEFWNINELKDWIDERRQDKDNTI
ncbi:MAG: hypothetical protein J6D03_00370 [Clostridia bacterium]|nr:hypothetical protein [Clostridia bacterium]